MAASSEDLIPKKGNVSSVIWNWFGFVASDMEQTAPRCKVCLAVATKGSCTTNLLQHLKQTEACCRVGEVLLPTKGTRPRQPKHRHHKQPSVLETFTNCIPYDKKGARWKAITDAVAMYIAKDMVPIYTVEKPGFIHLLKVLDPRYVLPSRKYFSDVALPQLYNSTHQRIAAELDGVSFYSATTDLWSSRVMQPYLSLTLHFINDDWTLRSVCLQTAYFHDEHQGEIIAQGLKDALSSWNLPEDRPTCMTTDSGTNMLKALRDNGWPSQPSVLRAQIELCYR